MLFKLCGRINGRVPTVREKSGENVKNSKSGNFENSQGNVKKMAKVREFQNQKKKF